MDQLVNISSSVLNATVGAASYTLKPLLKIIEKGTSGSPHQQQIILKETVYSLPPNMSKWIAIAGIMGASATAIGAYGVSLNSLVSLL